LHAAFVEEFLLPPEEVALLDELEVGLGLRDEAGEPVTS
jgi:hypothetical protein